MASSLSPQLSPSAGIALGGTSLNATDRNAKARGKAEDFETMFLNSMFQHMFSNVGEGPFSGGKSAATWRSFLTEEYAKSFVKSGGIGLANEVQRALLAQQEAS
jgi:peptidoglycan hydrolase FlgJ